MRARSLAAFRGQKRHFADAPQMYGNIPALKDNVEFKNIALSAAGGRSSVSGIRATIFGAGSRALGHQIVFRLGPIGAQCILPYRDDGHQVKICRMAGDLGQIVPIKYQIRDKDSVMRSLEGSNVAINLLTSWRETKNFSYHDIHVNSTHMIAKCAYELGVDRFIYISAVNAAEDSPSEYLRTKWLGEQIVREYYPEATILRPSIMYGKFDKFTQRMGTRWKMWMRMPYVIGPDAMVQPVSTDDVSLAVLKSVVDPLATAGKTFELYGDFRAKRERWMDRIGDSMCAQKPFFKRIEPAYRLPFLKAVDPLHRTLPQLFFRIMDHCSPGGETYYYDWFVRDSLDWIEPTRPYLGLRDMGITPTNYFDKEPELLYMYNTLEYKPHQAYLFEDENPGPNWEMPGQDAPHPIFDKRMANWPIPKFHGNNPMGTGSWGQMFATDLSFWNACTYGEQHKLPRDFPMQGSMYKKEYFKHLIYDY